MIDLSQSIIINFSIIKSMNTSTNIRSFAPLGKLGEGSFASVYKVKRLSDDKIYALKKIKMHLLPTKAKQNALNEVRFLASFHSPYIVNYYQAFFDQNLEALCIVMQYAEGGDLRKMISKYKKQKRLIPQTEIWRLLTNLTYGLKTLHDNSILHRDIKCQNIFVSGSLYKIGDMNVSKLNKNGLVYTQTGTPYYASPEVWKDQPYDDKSDIWSLGCILYELAALRPPFMGNTMQDIYKSVLKGTYPSIPQCYSNQLSNIIQQCLYINPKKRPSASTLLDNSTFKLYQNMLIQQKMPQIQMKVEMLQTICLPKDIKSINSLLPKAKYQTERKGYAVSDFNENIASVPITENQDKTQFKIIDNFVIGETENKVQPTLKQINKITQELPQNMKEKIVTPHPSVAPSPLRQIQNKIAVSNLYLARPQQKMQPKIKQLIKPYIKNQYKPSRRRILKQVQPNHKPRSRSKSLPRTQRKSMLASKQLTKSIQKIQQKLNNSKQIEGKNHRHHWNIIEQAKKYLQRSIHKSKSKKLF